MTTIDPTALKRQNTVYTKAIATNTKLLIKCRKKHQHQKIRLGKQNHLVEELDATTTKQTTTIVTLMNKIQDLEEKVTRTQALESRISILESLQADSMSQTLSPHMDTTSATQKSTSSIHLSQQDTITSNRTSKRRKTNNQNKNRSRAYTDIPQPNTANIIYAPNLTPQASTHAPHYNRN